MLSSDANELMSSLLKLAVSDSHSVAAADRLFSLFLRFVRPFLSFVDDNDDDVLVVLLVPTLEVLPSDSYIVDNVDCSLRF